MYYNKNYSSKPSGPEVGKIQKHLKQTTISITDLAKGLANGCTFKPGYLSGTKNADFVSQQIFALDFDEGTTIQDELHKCAELGIKPVFGYSSFSHMPERHKFRLAFCCNEAIEDKELRDRLQITLIKTFEKSDSCTKDASRLFFGGKNLIHLDDNARIDAAEVIGKYYNPKWDSPIPKSKRHEIDESSKQHSKRSSDVSANSDSGNSIGLKVEAIKARNIEVMRCLLGFEERTTTNKENNILSYISGQSIPLDTLLTFTCADDLYKHINRIDLFAYTGIPEKQMVCCILPKHDDSTPSANIFVGSDGTHIYKCFGCDKTYTIITLTEKLAGCRRSEAIEFIKSVYGLKLEKSDWAKEQIQIMLDSANYLSSKDFKVAFPYLAGAIRTRKSHIISMLLYFTQFVKDDLIVDDRPIFFSSYNKLLDVCGIRSDDRKKLSQSLSLFSLLNLLEKVSPEQIPEKELNKAKSIAARYGHKKLTTFYAFQEYGVNLLEDSEEIAKMLKANNMTLAGLNREFVLRTFGTEMADRIYPQFKFENKRGTSEASDNRTLALAQTVLYAIERRGYILEKDLRTDAVKESQWKRSIQEILNTYHLKKVKLSKALKEELCIDCKGFPNIIIPMGPERSEA